jgi:hypothetical protein
MRPQSAGNAIFQLRRCAIYNEGTGITLTQGYFDDDIYNFYLLPAIQIVSLYPNTYLTPNII